jgi:uncharacterized protein (TIGR03435 family)
MAQAPREFEVAAIHLSAVAPGAGTSVEVFEGGRIRIINEPIKLLVRQAFQVQNTQISGGPEWLDSDRYDIEAKTGRAEKPRPGDLAPLLQALLAERFHLKFHRETREMSVAALVVNPRPKLKASEGEANAMSTHAGAGKSHVVATGVTMATLAAYVSNRLGRVVIDKTGLSGAYDFELDWSPNEETEAPAPQLVTALREQLGLRLEPQKGPVEVLVIERLERPSEN